MSLFSWFLPKKAPAKAKPMEPTGLLNADATVPLVPGRDGRSTLEAPPPTMRRIARTNAWSGANCSIPWFATPW